MFSKSSFHIEIHPWVKNLTVVRQTGISHRSHELEATDVNNETNNKHDNVKSNVVMAEQRVHSKVNPVCTKNHISVECEGLNIFFCNQ